MSDSDTVRPLTGWQRAHILTAAHYVRDLLVTTPDNQRARVVYEGLLEVLEPTRRVLRQYREQRQAPAAGGSMWEQRSGRERRLGDRRKAEQNPPPATQRRRAQRRSGRDRRKR